MRVLVLGAGFGGLELTTLLSDEFAGDVDVTLIDQNDSFFFGFSKLDVMFGYRPPDEVRHYYRHIVKRGVRFVQASILSIDPEAKRAVTNAGTFEADYLVVALGADYDQAATPGLVEGGNEFYSFAGAQALREILPSFERGHAVIGVCGKSFKCPPAPSETALLLHDYLLGRGRRDNTHISVVIPFGTPIPPSPDTSAAILKAFEDRGIVFVKDNLVSALDPARKVLKLSGGGEMPCDLFLGIPVHRVPQVVVESGLSAHKDEWVAVNKQTLETRFANVFAVGDVNGIGTPKAGVFAEGCAKVVAALIASRIRRRDAPPGYDGRGACYIEFGHNQVARVDVQFLVGPKPTGSFTAPSRELAEEKHEFGRSRLRRWFGRGDALEEMARLKLKGERADSDMYDTHDAGRLAWFKDVAENAFIDALQIAREFDLKDEIAAIEQRLDQIRKTYRQLR